MIRIPGWLHLTLRQKLFTGFGITMIFVLAIGISSILVMSSVKGSLRTIQDEAFPQALASLDIESSINRIVLGIEASSESGTQSFIDEAERIQRSLRSRIGELKVLLEGNPQAITALEDVGREMETLFKVGEDLYLATIYMEFDRTPALLEQFDTLKETLLTRVADLKQNGVQKLEEVIADISEQASGTSQLILILGSIIFVSGIAVMILLSLSIMKPINSLVDVMRRAGQGDFTGRYTNPHTAHDEFSTIGEAFNNMMVNLVNLLTLVRNAASDVMTASKNLFDLSEGLRSGSDQQARSVDEVTSSIEEMNSSIRTVADNVEYYYKSAEESNSSIMEMSSSIEEVAYSAEQLTRTVENTGTLLNDLTASIREVALHTGNLSQEVEQSSAALMQIDSSVKEVADGAKNSSELASLVTERLTKEGGAAVSHAAQSIVQVRDIINDAAEVMRSLAERSGDIGKILQVIEEVSDQTRLLSLNAAILAAQSGSQGRAFSVIAEEIRALSDRTSSSTQEINQLLSSIPVEVEKVTQAIGHGTKKVDEGVKLIEGVKNVIDDVSKAARNSSNASDMITAATGEQVNGIRQAAELEQNIAAMSREIADAMKFQSDNCEQIMSSAEEMKNLSLLVMGATEEQSKGTKLLSHASSESMKMARSITEATKEEARGSELIVKSIEAVSDATSRNMEVFAQLGEMVATLSEHSRMLQEEMERFKVDGELPGRGGGQEFEV